MAPLSPLFRRPSLARWPFFSPLGFSRSGPYFSTWGLTGAELSRNRPAWKSWTAMSCSHSLSDFFLAVRTYGIAWFLAGGFEISSSFLLLCWLPPFPELSPFLFVLEPYPFSPGLKGEPTSSLMLFSTWHDAPPRGPHKTFFREPQRRH